MHRFKLNPNLLKALAALEFNIPTPIQEAMIPLALSGKDIIGIAQTGTGKTAAYLLPILMKLRHASTDVHPRALILVPTKELVAQVEQQCKDLVVGTDLRMAALYGGVGVQMQLEQVKKGTDILIATPGRLLEVYGLKGFMPKKINTLVLDEADRMLDHKFRQQLNDILEILPTKRQNFLMSATYPEKMEKMTEDFLEFPSRIEITPQATAAKNVEQFVYFLPNFLSKVYFLQRLLEDPSLNKVLVFVRSRETADNIFKFIGRKMNRKVRVLHSNKGQNSRLNAINAFKNDEIDVLVSTDVSARGIDVAHISHVINFEVPLDYLEYIHRIGRTGRAFNTGISITFANKAEKMHLERIEEIMGKKITFVPLPDEYECLSTPKHEIISIEKEIDSLRKKEDPTFAGAFHEKKGPARSQKSKPIKAHDFKKEKRYRGILKEIDARKQSKSSQKSKK